MANPFWFINADSVPLENLALCFINREEELDRATTALIDRRHNVLIYGERGTGKTFLLRMVEHHLRKRATDAFICNVNLGSLRAYRPDDAVAAFPRAVLLQLCSSLWREILGADYLDLRGRLTESGKELNFRTDEEKNIQRIYTQLMTMETSAKFGFSVSVGVEAVAKGEKAEKIERETKIQEVLPFEFDEFIRILSKVLAKRNLRRFIILCDEANQLPIFQQEELLQRFLELFKSKHTQFVFIAARASWEDKFFLPSCFETSFELRGFPKKEHLIILLEKANSTIKFESATIEVLWREFQGSPRFTLQCCAQCYEEASQHGESLITVKMVEEVCENIKIRERERDAFVRESMQRRNS